MKKQEPYNPSKHNDSKKYDIIPGTVWDHVIAALNESDSTDPIQNLAVLFHDVGKGVTHNIKIKNGEDYHTYHSHDIKGVELIENICSRLKISNNDKTALMFATQNHMKFHKVLEMKPYKILVMIQNKHFDILKNVSYCDDSCRKGVFNEVSWNQKIERINSIRSKWLDMNSEYAKAYSNMNGNRIMKVCNIQPSPLVGKILNKMREWMVNNNEIRDDILNKMCIQFSKNIK